MNITVNINAPELAQAINGLAVALSRGQAVTPEVIVPVQPAPVPSVPAQQYTQQPVQPAVPVQPYDQQMQQPVQPYGQQPQQYAQPYSAVPTAPVQQAQPIAQQTAVPTATQTYDVQQLAVAATALMEAGHNITALLSQFGVAALTQLPKERFGEFATALRGMGAKI